MRERFSVVMERMVYELRGVPCIALEDVTPDRKSSRGLTIVRSAGDPSRPRWRRRSPTYTARAAEKMRRQHLATRSLIVFVETNRFRPG